MLSTSEKLDKYEQILAKYDWHSSRPPRGYQPGAGRGAKMIVTTAELRMASGASDGHANQHHQQHNAEDALLDALDAMEEERQLAKKKLRRHDETVANTTSVIANAIANAAGVTDPSELVLPSHLLQSSAEAIQKKKSLHSTGSSSGSNSRGVLTLADLETVNHTSTVSVVKTTTGLTVRNARMEAAEAAEEYVFGDERMITSNDVLRARQLAAEKNLEQILGMGSLEDQTTWITHARALRNGGRRRRAWEKLVEGCQLTGHKGIWIWEERLSYLSPEQTDARRRVLEEATNRCPGEEKLWIWLLAVVPPHERLDRTQQAILACPSSERLWMRLIALTPTPKDQKRLLLRAVERTPGLASLFGRLARLEGAVVGRRLFQAAGKRHPSLALAVEAAKFVEWGLQREMQDAAWQMAGQSGAAGAGGGGTPATSRSGGRLGMSDHPTTAASILVKKEPGVEGSETEWRSEPPPTPTTSTASGARCGVTAGPSGLRERLTATQAMLSEVEKIVLQAARVYLVPEVNTTTAPTSSSSGAATQNSAARQRQWLQYAVRVAMGEDEESNSQEAAAKRRQRAMAGKKPVGPKQPVKDHPKRNKEVEGETDAMIPRVQEEEEGGEDADPVVVDPYYSPLHGYGWTASYMLAVFIWPELAKIHPNTPAAPMRESTGYHYHGSVSNATTSSGGQEQQQRLRSLESLLQQTTSASSAYSTWLLDLLALLPYASADHEGAPSSSSSSSSVSSLLSRVPYPVQSALLGAWWLLLMHYQRERAVYMQSRLVTCTSTSTYDEAAMRGWWPTPAPGLAKDALTLLEHVIAQMPSHLALSALPCFLSDLVRQTQSMPPSALKCREVEGSSHSGGHARVAGDDPDPACSSSSSVSAVHWVSYDQLLHILMEKGRGLSSHRVIPNALAVDEEKDDGGWWSHTVSLLVLLFSSTITAESNHHNRIGRDGNGDRDGEGHDRVKNDEVVKKESDDGSLPLVEEKEVVAVHATVVLAIAKALFERQAYPAAMSALHLGFRCHAGERSALWEDVQWHRSTQSSGSGAPPPPSSQQQEQEMKAASDRRAHAAILYLVEIAKTHAALRSPAAAQAVLEQATCLGLPAAGMLTPPPPSSSLSTTTGSAAAGASITRSFSLPSGIAALPWVQLAIHRRSQGEDVRALLDTALERHPRSEELWRMRLEAEVQTTRRMTDMIAAAQTASLSGDTSVAAEQAMLLQAEMGKQHQALRELCRRALQPAHCQHCVEMWILVAVQVESELLANAAAARALLVQAAKTCAGGPIELLRHNATIRRKRQQQQQQQPKSHAGAKSTTNRAEVTVLQVEELTHILLTAAKVRVEQRHSGPSAVREVVMELVQALPKVGGGSAPTSSGSSSSATQLLLPDPAAAASLFFASSSSSSSNFSSYATLGSFGGISDDGSGAMMVALSRVALEEMGFVLSRLIDCSPAATRGRVASQVVSEWKCVHLPAVLLSVGKLYHQAGWAAIAAAAAKKEAEMNEENSESKGATATGGSSAVKDQQATPFSLGGGPSSSPPLPEQMNPPQFMKAARQVIKALEVSDGLCGDAIALLWELCESPSYSQVVRSLIQEQAERVGVALPPSAAEEEDAAVPQGSTAPPHLPPPPSQAEVRWLVWSLTAWYQLGGATTTQHHLPSSSSPSSSSGAEKEPSHSSSCAAAVYCQDYMPYPSALVYDVKAETEEEEENKNKITVKEEGFGDNDDDGDEDGRFPLPHVPRTGPLWMEVSKRLDPSNVTLLGYRDTVEGMLRQVRGLLDVTTTFTQ